MYMLRIRMRSDSNPSSESPCAFVLIPQPDPQTKLGPERRIRCLVMIVSQRRSRLWMTVMMPARRMYSVKLSGHKVQRPNGSVCNITLAFPTFPSL